MVQIHSLHPFTLGAADSHREEALQQRRQLVESTGDLLERNKLHLEQHRAEERNRRIVERARAHQERWAAIVERHVEEQRRGEDARDELILLLSKEEEVKMRETLRTPSLSATYSYKLILLKFVALKLGCPFFTE